MSKHIKVVLTSTVITKVEDDWEEGEIGTPEVVTDQYEKLSIPSDAHPLGKALDVVIYATPRIGTVIPSGLEWHIAFRKDGEVFAQWNGDGYGKELNKAEMEKWKNGTKKAYTWEARFTFKEVKPLSQTNLRKLIKSKS